MLNRRRFVELGMAAGMGVGLSPVLPFPVLRAAPVKGDRSAILVFLGGGPSQLDTFDPKPDAPAEFRGEFASIPTKLPGVRFSEHLPQLANRADRFAILRAVSHSQAIHESGVRLMLTGDRIATAQSPSLGAVVAYKKRQMVPPAYVAVPAMDPNAGSLGPSCEPYNLLGDSGQLLAAGMMEGRAGLQRRAKLLADLDRRFSAAGLHDESLEVRNAAYRQAVALLNADVMRQLANLEKEPAALRDQYGHHDYGNYLLLARRAVEAGVRFVSVMFGGWDTHSKGFKTLSTCLPPLDQGLAALLDDLRAGGRLERTVLVVFGEFGRTPRVNAGGGRDHWPKAMSVLWAGGDAIGGRIIGSTDAQGADPLDNIVAPEDIAFTLMQQLGIDAATTVVPPGNRKLFIGGKRIDSLFA